MKSHWCRIDLNPYDCCLYQNGKFKQTHTEWDPQLNMKAEIWVILLQTMEHQRLLATRILNGREAWNRFSFKVLRKNLTCQHLDLGFLAPPKREIINFCFLSPPSCGEALANYIGGGKGYHKTLYNRQQQTRIWWKYQYCWYWETLFLEQMFGGRNKKLPVS